MWGIELVSVLVLVSKVTRFWCGDQNWPCLGQNQIVMSVIIDWLGFLWVAVVVDINSVFRCGAQVAWFQCGHRNWLDFCLDGRYWLDFSMGDQTWPDFSLGIATYLFCAWGSKMSWFIVSVTKLTWIFCDVVRPQIDIWVLTDAFVTFYETTQSPLTE